MSEILSVREVKLPVILSMITADDRGSLRQPGCPGFIVFFKLQQLELHSAPYENQQLLLLWTTFVLRYQSHGNCCCMVEAKRKDKDLI